MQAEEEKAEAKAKRAKKGPVVVEELVDDEEQIGLPDDFEDEPDAGNDMSDESNDEEEQLPTLVDAEQSTEKKRKLKRKHAGEDEAFDSAPADGADVKAATEEEVDAEDGAPSEVGEQPRKRRGVVIDSDEED